jgi:hypothetical protein
MQPESLSLFEALLLAISVSTFGLITQVIFRWHERRQLYRQTLIDRVYAELSVAEGVMYRVRTALVKTAADQCKFSRFEAEDYIFNSILAESRLTSLDLDLKQKSIDATDLVVAIHAHRRFCIDFLLKYEPEEIRIDSREFLAPMVVTEWKKLKDSAYCITLKISKS